MLLRARLVPPRDGERDPSPHWGGFVRASRKEGLTEGPERTRHLTCWLVGCGTLDSGMIRSTYVADSI